MFLFDETSLRVLLKTIFVDGSTSLELIGNLSTLMGFNGTMTDIPEAQLFRASFPAILGDGSTCNSFMTSPLRVLKLWCPNMAVSFFL